MEKAKKARTAQRSAFTRLFNELNAVTGGLEQATGGDEAVVSLELFTEKFEELKISDEKIFNFMVDGDATEEQMAQEVETCDEYKSKYLKIKNRVTQSWRQGEPPALGTARERQQKSFKLPKIELKKFNGDIKEWLQFWSQFKKIHEDDDIAAEDKFQYLNQSMVPGTRAYDLIQSYPPTAENYSKAITSLKNRFGRDELQVEVYVRELLKLVLQNAMKPQEKMQLSSLYDRLESHLRALETLGVTTEKCAAMLYPLVESSLPEDTLRAWQRSGSASSTSTKDRLTQLIEFLQTEVESEQRISMAIKGFGLKGDGEKNNKSKPHMHTVRHVPSAIGLLSANASRPRECIFCCGGHDSAACEKARAMCYDERKKKAEQKKACFKCLRIGHTFNQCRVFVKCAWCDKRHTVLMCPGLGKNTAEARSPGKEAAAPVVENNLASFADDPDVCLQTLKVRIRNGTKECIVRAIIDTGSHRSYILKSAAESLMYEPVGVCRVTHSLFGGIRTKTQQHACYYVRLTSMNGKYACRFKVRDQDEICSDISCLKSGAWRDEVKKLNIDISDFGEKALPITVLIGNDVAGKLWTGKRVQLECGLIAMETLLGWTLSGEVPKCTERCDTTAVETSLCVHEDKIADLWSLEVLGIRDPVERTTHKEHDRKVWDSLLESTHINEEGRYEVQLPWKANHAALNDNRDLARRRLESTIKKLKTDGYFTDYDQTLTEWKEEGICEEVPADEVNEWGHYLPHRHVIKENSTTRIRPVFDASARDGKNPSLNQCLEKGPNIIELIASILIRFRLGAIGVIADIRKAFLQISIYPKDRDCLRFLWIDSDGNILHMRHLRVVFGVTCSPFILGAVIDLHLRSEEDKENAEKLLQSFYVDNCVASVNSEDELREFKKGAVTMMSSGGFDLRGWEFSGDRSGGVPTNVLGIGWNKEDDTLMLNMPVLGKKDHENITKRTILSLAQRVFDPLGFVCPVLLFPRLILREIWAEKKSWDEPVNENTKDTFLKWVGEIGGLTEVKVRRCMMGSGVEETSLHTFCDASQSAYAAIVYLRVIRASGIDVYFVQAKNRLAPSKELTIPKLELTAATIGARLATSVLESLKLENIKTFFWSDSSTALAWIRRDDHWDPYVWNRVREIRELTGGDRWFHVDGHNNPADLPSRGCTVKTLLASRWWEGPQWLRSPQSEWPVENVSYDEDAISKGRRKTVAVRVGAAGRSLLEVNAVSVPGPPHVVWYAKYFSKYNRILRLISWIRRFILNCKTKKGHRVAGNLVANEIMDAEIVLLRLIQNESFMGIKDKRLERLVTYVDKNGLIRLDTKVTLRADTLDFRCPVVLPAEHVVVRLLIIYRHENLSHAGVQILLSNLREQYWILGGRKTLRAVLSKCVICRRHDAVPFRAIPAPLPVDRVREAAIFEIVGTDFAGPVFLRGEIKAYICLFTCAVFRAVHLELVTSLSTASFLEALRRFIARRGKPSVIYSDNGKNFVGFNNLIKTIDEDKLLQFGSAHRILWKFNPPTAAWWGGWWERLIGIMKRLLRKMLRNACLTYEEMCTVLCDCEAVVNSRPITFMSDGKQEFVPLTPSMFLQEIKEIGVPECDYLEKCKFNKRFQYRQKIRDDLRQRFRSEYLSELILKCKKSERLREIKVGDIVFLEKDNAKRVDWPLARVKDIIPGKGGKVRVVRVITASGELVRPIQRLYPLEVTYDEANEGLLSNKIESLVDLKECGNATQESERASVEDAPYITRSGRRSKKPNRL